MADADMERAREAFSGHYEDCQKALVGAVEASEKARGQPFDGWRANWTTFLHARVIVNVATMLNVMDAATDAPTGAQLLDHFSVASIARTITEASLMMLYISDPNVREPEWSLRELLFDLHDATHRIRFFKPASKSQPADAAIHQELANLREAAERIKKRMADNSHFASLDRELQTRILAGQDYFVGGVRSAVRSVGWDAHSYDFYSSYLSAFVHASPVSFYRAGQHELDFSTITAFQYDLCTVALTQVTECVSDLTARMIGLGYV